jgi:hypothetical protein
MPPHTLLSRAGSCRVRVCNGTDQSALPALIRDSTLTHSGLYRRNPVPRRIRIGVLVTAIATGALAAFVSISVIIVPNKVYQSTGGM